MNAYDWVVYGHIVTVILAFMAHGVSAFAMFRVRTERDRGRLAGILDLSGFSLAAAGIMLLLAIGLGLAAAIMGGHFSKAWPWVSIGIVVVVVGGMTPLAATPMRRVRTSLGLGDVKPGAPALVPASDEELAAALSAIRPEVPAILGIGGILVLSWLMRFKPF